MDSLLADLSSQQEIRRLADEFKRQYPHLHVLLNNAGGTFTTRQLSVDGIEMTFALNHLAYFLLTNLLLDTMKASTPARIINVSSDAHSGGKIDFDNLQGERSYSSFGPYGNSKLANILFTMELARRLEGTGVTVNALHPGLTSTDFGKNNPGLFMKIMGTSYRSLPVPRKKVRKHPSTWRLHQKYKALPENTSSIAKSPNQPAGYRYGVARKLWDISADMVHLADAVPEVA